MIQAERLGDREAPAGFETAANHGRGGGGRCRGQAERIGKLKATHLDAYVDRINGCVEFGQTGHVWHAHSKFGLN